MEAWESIKTQFYIVLRKPSISSSVIFNLPLHSMATRDYTFDIDNGLRVQDSDVDATMYFAIAMLGMILPFVVWNAFRYLSLRGQSKSSTSIARVPVAVSR